MARQVSSCHNCEIFTGGYLLCGVFGILCCLSLVLGNDDHFVWGIPTNPPRTPSAPSMYNFACRRATK